MKKLLLLFCSLLLVAGCGKPAATLPTVIGSGSVDIPAYKITAPAAGKILGLILESGERIGKGQPLFAIEQPELDAAVEDAATEAARADAELTNLESGSGEQAIAAADYSLQSAESSYQAAEQNYQKMASLYAQKRYRQDQSGTGTGSTGGSRSQPGSRQSASDTFDSQSFTRSYRTAKASSTTGTTALSTAAAKTAGQRSPEPLYRHSDGKTAKQRRYSCSGTTYPDYPRNRTMPGKSENAAAAGRSFKNRSGSNCRGAVLKKTFPGTITAIDNGTVTIMLENKLEELKAAMEVSISLKK